MQTRYAVQRVVATAWSIPRPAHALALLAGTVMLAACAGTGTGIGAGGAGLVHVTAAVETEPVASREDAADDAAIWVHPDDPAASLVIGTNKQAGLHVYDLAGASLQFVASGRPNNVDLRQGVVLPGRAPMDLVAASNRRYNGIDLYRVDAAARRLEAVSAAEFDTGMAEIYGLCMGLDPASGAAYVYANDKAGRVNQYRAVPAAGGRVGLERVRSFELDSQTEGCVVDDRSGTLFVGEEARGVWRTGAWPDAAGAPVLVAEVGSRGLVADVEGLTIADAPGDGFLVVSSQGNNRFIVYDLAPPHAYRGSFAVRNGTATDGVSETDGIALESRALGPFRGGLLVVQDGFNRRPRENQNFKYLDWGDVVRDLGLR